MPTSSARRARPRAAVPPSARSTARGDGSGHAPPRTDAPRSVSPELRDAILDWYADRGRELAFRGTTDPYAILVSEAMAQQTQAARAAEYWTRFLIEFPTVDSLARATPAAVLRAWRGLGYNRRAIALRQAAIAIVRDHNGQVPDDIEALERLPGVGPYTARAVAALAFGRPVGAVDVNVRRVLNRVLGGSLDAFSPAELQVVADASVPRDAPGLWTHALMDIGATFCKPRAPRCDSCPAQFACCYAATHAPPETTLARPESAARVTRERPAHFSTTSRWLRGRILDLLRDAPGETWSQIPESIGSHDQAAVTSAIAALDRDGLLEQNPIDPSLVRLPID
ncbi:MAG: A/G-specific adenine glycosylase [Chloroflexota bacterium]